MGTPLTWVLHSNSLLAYFRLQKNDNSANQHFLTNNLPAVIPLILFPVFVSRHNKGMSLKSLFLVSSIDTSIKSTLHPVQPSNLRVSCSRLRHLSHPSQEAIKEVELCQVWFINMKTTYHHHHDDGKCNKMDSKREKVSLCW